MKALVSILAAIVLALPAGAQPTAPSVGAAPRHDRELKDSAPAASETWSWLWVVPSPDPSRGWSSFTGQASMTFDGTTLDGTLEGRGDWEPTLRVHGRIAGRHATLTITEMGTDANPAVYSGDYLPARSRPGDPSRGWGWDRIAARSGVSYLAFYRRVHSS